jgi:hypothetical protein
MHTVEMQYLFVKWVNTQAESRTDSMKGNAGLSEELSDQGETWC